MSIASLQSHFPSFLLQLAPEKKELTPTESAALQLFSETLQKAHDDRANLAKLKSLHSIQKHWTLLCKELFLPCTKLSAEFFKSRDKLHAKLYDLTTDTSLIVACLEDREVDLSLDEERSILAKKLLLETPKAICNTKVLIKRIQDGIYGESLCKKLYDLVKNPLLVKEHLLRMLYIDLLLRKLDPQQECEWFGRSESAVQQALEELQGTLEKKSKLARAQVFAILIDSASLFSQGVQEKFNALIAQADFAVNRHNSVLELVGPYFAPTPKVLETIAFALSKKQPEKALQIALKLDTRNTVMAIILQAATKDDSVALLLLKQAQRKFRDLTLEALLQSLIAEPKNEQLDTFYNLLNHLDITAKNLEVIDNWFVLLSKRPFTETAIAIDFILALLCKLKGDAFLTAKKLEICFTTQLSGDNFEAGVDRCGYLLKRFSPDHALGCLQFVVLSKSSPQQDFANVKTLCAHLTDKMVRQGLLLRLVRHISSAAAQRKDVARLEMLERYFLEPEEKKLLIKERLLLLSRFDRQEALKLAKLVPDVPLSISLLRLLQTRNFLQPAAVIPFKLHTSVQDELNALISVDFPTAGLE